MGGKLPVSVELLGQENWGVWCGCVTFQPAIFLHITFISAIQTICHWKQFFNVRKKNWWQENGWWGAKLTLPLRSLRHEGQGVGSFCQHYQPFILMQAHLFLPLKCANEVIKSTEDELQSEDKDKSVKWTQWIHMYLSSAELAKNKLWSIFFFAQL